MMKRMALKGGTLGTQVRKPGKNDSLSSLVNLGQNSGGGGYYVQPTVSPPSDSEVMNGLVSTLYSAYKPTPLVYTSPTAEDLRGQIEAWLRPSYDRAILNRQTRTKTYRAELDADAISRGMGTSSYVTDVKSRQMQEEAEDVAELEDEYGAALAETLSAQLESERERMLEADMFNRGNDHDAYMRAYSAALSMFAAYKAQGSGVSGGYYVSGGGKEVVPTTPENCDTFLSILTPEERTEVYQASTDMGAQYRAELIASVGLSGYFNLMGKYGGSW